MKTTTRRLDDAEAELDRRQPPGEVAIFRQCLDDETKYERTLPDGERQVCTRDDLARMFTGENDRVILINYVKDWRGDDVAPLAGIID